MSLVIKLKILLVFLKNKRIKYKKFKLTIFEEQV